MSEYRWEGRTAEDWRRRLRLPAVHLFDVIDSTNNVALRLAEEGAPTLTLVLADYQTAGRGRAGRSWSAEPGHSLLFTVVFRTPPGEQHPGTAPVRIGWHVADVIERLTGHPMKVKWPNDVVAPGHGKVAGILCEGVVRQSGHAYIVAGIGVNVRATGAGYTALADLGHAPGRGELLAGIIERLHTIAQHIIAPLGSEERNAFSTLDLLSGEMVENEDGVRGHACGISRDGSLLVETAEGVRALQSANIRLAGTHKYPGSRS